MDIYYYCTYSRSPLGYVLGTLAYPSNQTTNYELKEENIDPLIRKCFEDGRVLKGFGFLPNKHKCFVLIKNLNAYGTTDEDADYNMNIAFVTEDEKTYRELLREEDADIQEQDIADMLKETMEIDRKSDFGFTVRPRKLDELLAKSFRSLFDENVVNDALKSDKPYTYFGLLSSQTDLADLSKSLGLLEPGKVFERRKHSKKWVRYGTSKKKRSLRKRITAVVDRIKNRIVAVVNWIKEGPVWKMIAAVVVLAALGALLIAFLKKLQK